VVQKGQRQPTLGHARAGHTKSALRRRDARCLGRVRKRRMTVVAANTYSFLFVTAVQKERLTQRRLIERLAPLSSTLQRCYIIGAVGNAIPF